MMFESYWLKALLIKNLQTVCPHGKIWGMWLVELNCTKQTQQSGIFINL